MANEKNGQKMCSTEVCHPLRKTCVDYQDFNWLKCPAQNFRTACWSNNRVLHQIQQILALTALVKQSRSHPNSTNPDNRALIQAQKILALTTFSIRMAAHSFSFEFHSSSATHSSTSSNKKKLVLFQFILLLLLDDVSCWKKMIEDGALSSSKPHIGSDCSCSILNEAAANIKLKQCC